MNKQKEEQLFPIAIRNIKAYGWLNAKLCFTFACLAFLICLFTVYNGAISARKEEAEREYMSSNCIFTEITATRDAFKDLGLEFVHEDVYVARNFNTELQSMYGWSGSLNASYVALQIDGKQYNAYKKLAMNCIAEPEKGLLYDYDLIELKQRYGINEQYKEGGSPLEKDEVAISENVLDAFDLTADDVMGKEITVYLKPKADENKEPLRLFTARICGILYKEISSLSGRKTGNYASPCFMFNREHELFKTRTTKAYRMYLKDWPTETQAMEWLTFSSAYVGYGCVKSITGLSNLKTLGSNLYVVVGFSLFVSLLLTVFLMIDKYTKVFSRFGGIMLTLGLKQNKMHRLLFIQLLMLCFIAVPISFIMTYAGYKTITLIMSKITRISLSVSTAHLLAIMSISIAIVVAIALILFAYVSLRLRRKTIKELLMTVPD